MGIKKRSKRINENMEIEHPNAAGIDIGSREIWVSVDEKRDDNSVRSFTTLTTGLHELADWLEHCSVDTVAMEATGVYWVPLYEVLQERGIDVNLVNAHHVKCVPGRKSDVLDCQWLRKLHRFGLLRSSFRPSAEIVTLRAYLRQRDVLVRLAADDLRRMQKALTLMNLQFHNVLSELSGKTGMAILRAIVAGERDPAVLAKHRHPGCRASREQFEASLTGNYQPEHLFALRQALSLYDTHKELVAQCDQAVSQCLDSINASIDVQREPMPNRKRQRSKRATIDFSEQLYQLVGVDLTAVPGLADYNATCLISEIGTDMSHWRNAKAFASWLRTCPRADITGGKPKSRRTLPSTNRAAQILRMAALNAGRTNTAIGAFYRRIAIKRCTAVAVVATANRLARMIYTLIKNQTTFVEPGAADYDARQRKRALRNLQRRAKSLGVTVVETAA